MCPRGAGGFLMRSRSDALQLVLCNADALLAAQASSFGRQIDGGKKVEDAHSLQSNEIGINPFTKEPCVFKAKLASKTVRALAMKKLKEALN